MQIYGLIRLIVISLCQIIISTIVDYQAYEVVRNVFGSEDNDIYITKSLLGCFPDRLFFVFRVNGFRSNCNIGS